MSPVSAIFTKYHRFLAEASRSRLAWLLVFLHAAWFLLAIANMSPPSRDFAHFLEHVEGSDVTTFAGRPFHFHNESLPLQILSLFDLPSSLAAIPLAILLFPVLKLFHVGMYEGSYIGAVVLFVMSALQCLIIGKLADDWLSSRPWGVSTVRRISRHFVVLSVLIFFITAVSVPLLNARSQRLAFRHTRTSNN